MTVTGPSRASSIVVDVRAGKKTRQVPKQAQAADWAPADVLYPAIGSVGFWRDHHFSARELAVAEGQEEARPTIPLAVGLGSRGGIEAMGKRRMLEAGKTSENAEDIAELAKALETAIHGLADVRREAKAQQIDEVKFAVRMPETNDIHGAPGLSCKSVDRVLGAARREVFQKRVASAEGQKAERNTIRGAGPREKTIHDFVGGAIAANGQNCESLAHELGAPTS